MPSSQIFNVPNMSFNAIRENKFLMKISEFPVCKSRSVIRNRYQSVFNIDKISPIFGGIDDFKCVLSVYLLVSTQFLSLTKGDYLASHCPNDT